MIDRRSSEAGREVKETLKAFANLLKEFPKSAAGDFIYDDATIKKIKLARDALVQLDEFLRRKSPSLETDEKKAIKESAGIFSRLMNELPRKAADEFLYDRQIHQQVEETREAIVRLAGLFP